MNYTLGLDIGITSVGWAVLRNNMKDEPIKIEDLGVRVFPAAEHPKTGASLAMPRREARSARRRIRRRRHRKERIRALLSGVGLMSRDEMDTMFQMSGFEKDVYTLRAEGLDRKLEPSEWVRVLIHLSQRRGYRSNSKAAESQDKEKTVVKEALKANRILMEEKGYRTVGEMFCKDEKFRVVMPDGQIWRKTRNSPNNYQFTVTRTMVEAEVRQLFAAQRTAENPFAGEELEEQYLGILLSQRNFDEGPGGDSPFRRDPDDPEDDPRGLCSILFKSGERRAFKACYTFEYYKLLNDLNHIRLLSNGQPTRPLTPQERDILTSLAMKTDGLTYDQVRKALKLPSEVYFNTVRYDDKKSQAECERNTKFSQMQSYHEICRALNRVSSNYARTLNQQQLDEIGTILSLKKSDDKRRPDLKEMGLEDAAIEALLPLSFSKTGSLSLTAMRKLIPYLERGIQYPEARKTAYGDPEPQERKKILSFDALQKSGALKEITNPVVLRAVSQTCKVVNAIIRKYGSPQLICVELAREMSRSHDERKEDKKKYDKRQEENEKAMAYAEEIKGSHPSGRDLVKFKLFREQDGVCLYSGVQLDAHRLFEEGYVDVDHIIPYSISFDDSYNNKVLVLSKENRQKGNRLPMQYLADDPDRRSRFEVLVNSNVRNRQKRQRLLKTELTSEDLKKFKDRNLSDTRYATRVVYNLLNDNLEFAPSTKYAEKPVRAVNGAVTDYMRKRFGLQKNRADGDLHHAMDAAVVATITDGMIQRISNYDKRIAVLGRKYAGSYVDPETGELLSKDAFDEKYAPKFPEPWPCFRKELEARLSPDPAAEIAHLNLPHYEGIGSLHPVFVSHMPKRKVSGPAHEATIRSGKEAGYAISRTPLEKLKLEAKTSEIEDYYHGGNDRLLYEALKARLLEYGGDAKKAFAQPFHKPKRDGTDGPVVHSVKTYEKKTSNVPVRGGIADNGEMVRIDVFYVEKEGYYIVPIYQADTVKPQLPNRAIVAHKGMEQWKVMDDRNFQFSLYPGDLIRVAGKRPISLQLAKDAIGEKQLLRKEWVAYYISTNISSGAIGIETHDRKYYKDSLGVKTLELLEKYEVDVLGNYHRVRIPEKRQTFR